MKGLMFFLIVSSFGMTAQADVDISPGTMIRCHSAGLNPERCEVQRKYALAKGCINQNDYNRLQALGGMPTCFEADGTFMGWCPCGCFAPDTAVKVNGADLSQEEKIERVVQLFALNNRPTVARLNSYSKEKGVEFASAPVRNVSVGPEEAPMVIIDTANSASKGHIELTINHPVLLEDGSIIRAEKLQPGQKLLNYKGQPETITGISRKKFEGLVYNLNVDSQKDSEHIVSANGLLMGDLYLQGSMNYFENQVLVRQ